MDWWLECQGSFLKIWSLHHGDFCSRKSGDLPNEIWSARSGKAPIFLLLKDGPYQLAKLKVGKAMASGVVAGWCPVLHVAKHRVRGVAAHNRALPPPLALANAVNSVNVCLHLAHASATTAVRPTCGQRESARTSWFADRIPSRGVQRSSNRTGSRWTRCETTSWLAP